MNGGDTSHEQLFGTVSAIILERSAAACSMQRPVPRITQYFETLRDVAANNRALDRTNSCRSMDAFMVAFALEPTRGGACSQKTN